MTATALRKEAEAIAEAVPDVSPHRSLAPALVAALAELTTVKTAHTANAGSFSYDYADLGDVVSRTRPALAAQGIVALTPIHDYGSGLACTVVLLHSSGERMDFGPFPFPHGRDAQATGSAITYHRRYALLAALGMAAGNDDDGAAATARPSPPPVWNLNVAKQHVLKMVEGNKELAAQCVEGTAMASWAQWREDTVTAAVEEWVNVEPEPAVNHDGH